MFRTWNNFVKFPVFRSPVSISHICIMGMLHLVDFRISYKTWGHSPFHLTLLSIHFCGAVLCQYFPQLWFTHNNQGIGICGVSCPYFCGDVAVEIAKTVFSCLCVKVKSPIIKHWNLQKYSSWSRKALTLPGTNFWRVCSVWDHVWRWIEVKPSPETNPNNMMWAGWLVIINIVSTNQATCYSVSSLCDLF